MSSCKKCDKFNPFSVFSFLRSSTKKNKTRSSKMLRKTMKKGGWRKSRSNRGKK